MSVIDEYIKNNIRIEADKNITKNGKITAKLATGLVEIEDSMGRSSFVKNDDDIAVGSHVIVSGDYAIRQTAAHVPQTPQIVYVY